MHETLNKVFEKEKQRMKIAKQFNVRGFVERMERVFLSEGYREKIESKKVNILIIRLDAIGDFILTTGTIREIRQNFPDAHISLVVRSLVKPLAEACPYVDDVFVLNQTNVDIDFWECFSEIVCLCSKNLWQYYYDYCFIPQWGYECKESSFLLAYCSGAKRRIGYSMQVYKVYLPQWNEYRADWEESLMTEVIVSPKELCQETIRYLYLLKAAGLKIDDVRNELWYGKEDKYKAEKILQQRKNELLIILGIGAGAACRKYPVEMLNEALNVISKYRVDFIVVGGESEKIDGAFLNKNSLNNKILNLAGKTTLTETAAIIADSDMYIGNDTGMMHMAAAAGVPIIVISKEAEEREDDKYVPGVFSSYVRFEPWLTDYIALRPKEQIEKCKERLVHGGCASDEAHCIKQIKPEEIVEAFECLVKTMAEKYREKNMFEKANKFLAIVSELELNRNCNERK